MRFLSACKSKPAVPACWHHDPCQNAKFISQSLLIRKYFTCKMETTLQVQLDELELLQSMYSSPGELHIQDQASYAQTLAYCKQLVPQPAQSLSFNLALIIDASTDSDGEDSVQAQGAATNTTVYPLEIAIRLANRYPDVLPDVYLSSKDLHRTNQDQLNSDLRCYMNTISLTEPCLLTIVEWIRDNSATYFPVPISHSITLDPKSDQSPSHSFCRLWLYMHHIYSKTKRRNILSNAHDLDLTGFCLPGKPGVVCVEGTERNTREFYSILRRWNWKSITCRRRDEIESCDIGSCRKVSGFQELVLDVQGTHLNLGQFLEYLKQHELEYMFKELFGVDGQH